MNEKISVADLSEMLEYAYTSDEMGFPKVQIDTEHAIEILSRLIELENMQ